MAATMTVTALHTELPRRQDTEQILNVQWDDLWHPGMPLPAAVEYSAADNDNQMSQRNKPAIW
jgi:hypothetical protein